MPGVGTTHHVEIGGHYYLIKPGSYSKRAAPQFGARFTTGDPDYNNLSFWQHWAQRCWVGGMDAEEWADDAMYDDGVGVNTTEHEKVTLSRDLARGAGANWALTANAVGHKAVIYNQKLYVVSLTAPGVESELWEYIPGSDGWSKITAFTGVVARSVGTFDGKLFIGGLNTGGTAPILKYSNGNLGTWTTVTNPAGVASATKTVRAMRAFQQKFYVAFGTHVWRMKDDQTWDGNTVFYKADQNSESNYIVNFEVHLGFLYGISDNGHIHRTDGNTTFDIWNWDGGTKGVAIKSFDGRLFVITYEYSNTAEVGYGVLYQMSGSAMTELKRWGKATESNIIGSLMVHDRKLWYGASNLLGMRAGFGVAVYDPVEDAHSIHASNSDTVTFPRGVSPFTAHIVDDVIVFQGRIYAFVRGHGAVQTPYAPRDLRGTGVGTRRFDITGAGVAAGPQNGGWFTSSTYDAGTPGLRKLWRKVTIDYSLPNANVSITVEYSTDNGNTYTALPTITSPTGLRLRKDFWLNNVISVSFKLRVTLRSTSSTQTPYFLGWTVSYIPIPEPNWLWTFTIVLSEKQQLMDGTDATVDTEAELLFLDNLFRSKQLIRFVDVDGKQWASATEPGVMIYDIQTYLLDLTQPLEGEVTLTLLEAVETY